MRSERCCHGAGQVVRAVCLGPPNHTHWVVWLVDLGIHLTPVSDMVGEVGGLPRWGRVPIHPTYVLHAGIVAVLSKNHGGGVLRVPWSLSPLVSYTSPGGR